MENNDKKVLVIDSRPYGLFSIFLHTIDNLKWAEDNNYIPYIRWNSGRIDPNLYREGAREATKYGNPSYVKDKNNFLKEQDYINNIKQSLYYQKEYGDNIWEYYFEKVSEINILNLKETKHDISDIFMCGDLDFNINNKFLIKNVHSYDSLILWDLIGTNRELEHRNTVNKYIKKYVKIKKEIQEKFDIFLKNKFKDSCHYIGVHIRGTDKKTEYPHKTVSLEYYLHLINQEIQTNCKSDNFKLVIASDNNEAILYLAKYFGKEKIISYPSQRASTYLKSTPIFFSDINDRKKMGEEVLIEMLLLSNCNVLIGTDSNVTATACYYNPNMNFIYVDRKKGDLI